MKKLKFGLFLCFVFVCLLLIGCSNNDAKPEDAVEAINEWVLANCKEGVASDIELPLTCPDYKDSKIEWFSDDPFILDNTGKIGEREKKATKVDFSYVITYKGYSKEFVRTFVVTAVTFDRAIERFESQFPKFVFENQNWTVLYDSVISVSWESSNTEIFSNEGIYTKPEQDTTITITYTVTDGNTKITKTKDLLIQGKTALDYFNEAQTWLINDFAKDRYIVSDLELPTTYDNKVSITWSSTDEDAIDPSTGKITKTLYDRYVNLTAKLSIENSSKVFSFDVVVEKMDISKMTKQEMLEEFIRVIAVKDISKLFFGAYGNITQTYNFINFFTNEDIEIIDNFIPAGMNNRPGEIRKVEYVTVHDTANNTAGALANSNWCAGGCSGQDTSWHYTIGEDACYRQAPDEEVLWHAGDGSRFFQLDDTGIKATAKRPVITFDENGYYAINGVSTKLRPYTDRAGTQFTNVNYETSDINKMGIYCEIGENGNYYLGKTYYSTSFGYISNFGGNKNGIGIESCVEQGSDYATTTRRLANLVANLCIKFNLGLDRVQGHHFFSGKGCPNALMTANYWYNFKNLVSLEIFAKENFEGYKFEWTSNSSLLDKQGKISLNAKANDELKYSVKVSNGTNVVYENSFTTIVK